MPRALTKAERDARRDEELRRRLGCPFLDTAETAEYLRVSPHTLAEWRVKGRGPKYRKHFRSVVYHVDELDAWSATRAQSATCERPKTEGSA